MTSRAFRNSVPDHPTPREQSPYPMKCAECGRWEMSDDMYHRTEKAKKLHGPICIYCENDIDQEE